MLTRLFRPLRTIAPYALIAGFLPIAVPILHAAQFPEHLNGRILLDVTRKGEAWYVDPVTHTRHYLADGTAGYSVMRDLGLGVSNADLARIPIGYDEATQYDATRTESGYDTDADGLTDSFEQAIGTDMSLDDTDADGYTDKQEVVSGFNPTGAGRSTNDQAFASRLSGRILLQVQGQGEAWYVRPEDKKRYYMRDGKIAYAMMRTFGLGAATTSIDSVPVTALQTDCGGEMDCFMRSVENMQPARVRRDTSPYPDNIAIGHDSLYELDLAGSGNGRILRVTDMVKQVTAVCDLSDTITVDKALREWYTGEPQFDDGYSEGDLIHRSFGINASLVGTQNASTDIGGTAYRRIGTCKGYTRTAAISAGVYSKRADDVAKMPKPKQSMYTPPGQ